MAKTASRGKPDIRGVGGVIYRFDDQGQIQILLIKKRGGYWTLPKGKLMAGEKRTAALIREVGEETGLTGEVGPVIRSVCYTIIKQGQPLRKRVTYYLVRATGGTLTPSKAERIVRIGWFAPRTALRRIKRGRICVVLRRACAALEVPLK